MRSILMGLIGLTIAGGASAQDRPLSGPQISKAFAGHTISGVEDGERYSETLDVDGDIEGSSSEGRYGGEWDVDGDEICFSYDDGDEDCSRVRLTGRRITFLGDGEPDTQALLK